MEGPKQGNVLHAENFLERGEPMTEVRGASMNGEIMRVWADMTKYSLNKENQIVTYI